MSINRNSTSPPPASGWPARSACPRWPPPSRPRATIPIRTSPSRTGRARISTRSGIRAGSFFIFPSISLSGTYDSNAFATSDDEDSDVGGILAPRVDVNSDWSRHALNFSAGAVGAAWAEYSENNYLDAFAATTGRLDVTRDDIATGTLRLDRLHEDRDDPDESGDTTIGTSDRGNLTRYYRGLLDGQYRHNFARFFTVVGGGVQRLQSTTTSAIAS